MPSIPAGGQSYTPLTRPSFRPRRRYLRVNIRRGHFVRAALYGIVPYTLGCRHCVPQRNAFVIACESNLKGDFFLPHRLPHKNGNRGKVKFMPNALNIRSASSFKARSIRMLKFVVFENTLYILSKANWRKP
jgi:hypothetical protein